MGITLGVGDRSKPRGYEESGMVLSGLSFGVTLIINLEGSWPGEVYTLDNSEGTKVGNKLGISNGEVMGITLVVVERSKLGGDESSGQVLSGGKV